MEQRQTPPAAAERPPILDPGRWSIPYQIRILDRRSGTLFGSRYVPPDAGASVVKNLAESIRNRFSSKESIRFGSLVKNQYEIGSLVKNPYEIGSLVKNQYEIDSLVKNQYDSVL